MKLKLKEKVNTSTPIGVDKHKQLKLKDVHKLNMDRDTNIAVQC